MAWRLHLINQGIQRLQILEGDPAVLAAWSRRDQVAYYDLETGRRMGDHTFVPPDMGDREDPAWVTFLAEFKAPNEIYLPVVELPDMTIYTTDDGRMHLYHPAMGPLMLENDGREDPLDAGKDDVEFITAGLDRFLGLIAAIDKSNTLHLYQQHIRVGAFEVPFELIEGKPPILAVPRGSSFIYLTEGNQLFVVDSSGQVRRQVKTHYVVGEMVCSQQGIYVMTSDTDGGVIRIYEGTDLNLVYQRFAVDLVAQAQQVQLMADLPSTLVAPKALAITDEGILAFAMSGIICVSDISQMDEVPRPQSLF